MINIILISLFNNMILFSILFAGVLLVKAAFRGKLSAAAHYIIWGVVVIRLLVPLNLPESVSPWNALSNITSSKIVVQNALPDQSEPVVNMDEPIEDGSIKTKTSNTPDNPAMNSGMENNTESVDLSSPDAKTLVNWSFVCLVIWIIGMIVFAVRLFINSLLLKKETQRTEHQPSEAILEIYEKYKMHLRIRKDIKIFIQRGLQSPAITGIVKTKLLMPDQSYKPEEDRLNHIFIHELMHFKRGDLLALRLLNILSIIYWFNPLVWLCFALIRKDMEIACDAMVLDAIGDDNRRQYIQTIINFSTIGNRTAGLQTVLSINDGRINIARRIKSMFMIKRTKVVIKTVVVILTAMLMFTCFTTACKSTMASYIDDESDDSPLKVYLMYWDYQQQEAIEIYNRYLLQDRIEGRKVEITEFNSEHIDDMYNRIANEILAGEGPDIIFVDSTFNTKLDFVSMSTQNVFADMDKLIENSDTFNFENYNINALDAGVINGTRTLMPLSYSVNYMVTTNENMDKLNMTAPENLSYQTFFNIMQACHENTDSSGACYGIGQLFYDLISPEGLTLEKTTELKKYIDLLNVDNEKQALLGDIGGSLEDFYQYICNGKILMSYSGYAGGSSGEFDLFSILYNIVENSYNKNIVIMNEPSYDNKTYAYLDLSCAININSKHKNDAFKFIEFLLSEQCQYSDSNRTSRFPVNNAAYVAAKEDFMNDEYYNLYKDDEDYGIQPLPDNIKDSYINIIENVSAYKYSGREEYIMSNIINESVGNYMDKKITYEQMVEEINNKLRLYYSE